MVASIVIGLVVLAVALLAWVMYYLDLGFFEKIKNVGYAVFMALATVFSALIIGVFVRAVL